MTRLSKSTEGLPAHLSAKLSQIGENVRLARKRRGLTMEDMAARMFVTRKTLSRLEKGEPSVSMGVVASALLVLGLDNDLERIANPSEDEVGNVLNKEKFEQIKRVRQPKKPVDMNF